VDEWRVTTPLLVAQSHHGFSRDTVDGVGRHDLAVVLDIPNRHWSTAFKPYNLPFLLVDVEHAYAARWWILALLVLIPSYGLMLLLVRRTSVAILFSLALYLSPFFHWWYEVLSFATIGLGLIALTCFLGALGNSSPLRRFLWLVGSAYGLVSFVLVFYPPFQVPVSLVLVAVGVAYVYVLREEQASFKLSLVARELVVVLVIAGVVVGLFFLDARSTILAVTGTAYPGKRRITGGNSSFLQFFSTPFGLVIASHPAAISATTNESELASFAMLAPFMILQLFRLRIRDLLLRYRALLLATIGIFVVLAVWYYTGLPEIVARVTFLNRSPPGRTLIGIGLADLLITFLYVSAKFSEPIEVGSTTLETLRRIRSGAAMCAALAFVFCFWVGRQFGSSFPGLKITLRQLELLSLVFATIVLLLVLQKVLLGGAVLVVATAALSLSVNPVYRGLGELTSSPLRTSVTSIESTSHKTWLSFAGSGSDVDLVLLASGVPTMNAVSLYPDQKAWHILDPGGAEITVWNRYANIVFEPLPNAGPPVIRLIQADALRVDEREMSLAARKPRVPRRSAVHLWPVLIMVQVNWPMAEALVDPLSAPRVYVLMVVPKMVRKQDLFPVACLLG